MHIYNRSLGLMTADAPNILPFNPETGEVALQAAVNVTHRGREGRLGMRRGTVQQVTGNMHSIFCDGGPCFFAEDRTLDTAIYNLSPDFGAMGLRSELAKGRWISWTRSGEDYFYCNGRQNGFIREMVSYPWPDQSAASTFKTSHQYSPAPLGRHIAVGHGRMWIAMGNYVYYSEPFAFGRFDLARCHFGFKSETIMVLPVAGGVFISDRSSIWFYSGRNPSEMEAIKRSDFPVTERAVSIDKAICREAGVEGEGKCHYLVTVEGLFAATDDGRLEPITVGRVAYPDDLSQGSVLLHDYNAIQCVE